MLDRLIMKDARRDMETKGHFIYEHERCDLCGCKGCTCEEELEIAVTAVEEKFAILKKYSELP